MLNVDYMYVHIIPFQFTLSVKIIRWMEQDINYCKNSAKIAQRFAASKTYTALMSLVIFARKDDKLKFSCSKFIIF